MKNHPMVLVTKTDTGKTVKNIRATGEEDLTLSAILFSLWILLDLMIIVISMYTPPCTPKKISRLFHPDNDEIIAKREGENGHNRITNGGPENIFNEKTGGKEFCSVNTEKYENNRIRFHHFCLNKTLLLMRRTRSRISHYIHNIRGVRGIYSIFCTIFSIIRWFGKLIYKIGVNAAVIVNDILDIIRNVSKFCIMAIKIVFPTIKIIIRTLNLISKI